MELVLERRHGAIDIVLGALLFLSRLVLLAHTAWATVVSVLFVGGC
jgi:hypothetical protein